jgi:bifunctional DNA-binding transcriptional regulator/antitoxin component of YhaV-PrlF toxin-antitoxin module
MFQVSGKGNITTRVSIPLQWLEDLGISESDRDVKLTKKKNKIILEKAPGEGEI